MRVLLIALLAAISYAQTVLPPTVGDGTASFAGSCTALETAANFCSGFAGDCVEAYCRESDDACFVQNREFNHPCEVTATDVDGNEFETPGVCVDGECLYSELAASCDGLSSFSAERTVPSCDNERFYSTWRFRDLDCPKSGTDCFGFGPMVGNLTCYTSQTADDPDHNVFDMYFQDENMQECLIGANEELCRIHEPGTYHYMGMVITWSGLLQSGPELRTVLEIDVVTKTFVPRLHCPQGFCRAFVECFMSGTEPCGRVVEECITPSPTDTPSYIPTKSPSENPSTDHPTGMPSACPTTDTPSRIPTKSPSANPSADNPTCMPTPFPSSDLPSKVPTRSPSANPSSEQPTNTPSACPTTDTPSHIPTKSPSANPSTDRPTGVPSACPTTDTPSRIPTKSPSANPSTDRPTDMPSAFPTTEDPSQLPTFQPTQAPSTDQPSCVPSSSPSTEQPSNAPTFHPTQMPSNSCQNYVCAEAYDNDIQSLSSRIDELVEIIQTQQATIDALSASHASVKALFAPQAFAATCEESTLAPTSNEESPTEEPSSGPAMEWFASGTKCQFGSDDRVFKRTAGDLNQCSGACLFYSEKCLFFSYDTTNRVCIGCAVEPTEIDENYETYAIVSKDD